MKKQYRFLSVLLIAALLAAIPAAVLADYDPGVSVYIPNKLERLHIPDMPEYIALFTRTQSVSISDDPSDTCPIRAVNEPDIELFFSEQPDWAAVVWTDGLEYITVNENGYAKVSSAGHKTQPGVDPNTYVDSTTGDRLQKVTNKPAQTGDGAFLAGKENVTVMYNRDGSPAWIEYAIPDDFYKTGIDGAVTVFRYEPVTIDGDFYVYDKDENGNYILEPTGKKARVIVDEEGNTIDNINAYDKNKKYSYKKDSNGKYIYEDVMQKKRINLKGQLYATTIKKGDTESTEYVIISHNHLLKDYSFKIKHINEGRTVQVTVFDKNGKSCSTFNQGIDYFNNNSKDYSLEDDTLYSIKDLPSNHIFDDFSLDISQNETTVHVNFKYSSGNTLVEYEQSLEEFLKSNTKQTLSNNNKAYTFVDSNSLVHWYYTNWYCSTVVANYPEDINYIVRVESDWRNDSGKFLWGYKITYATSANERYKITYMPNTATILEDHQTGSFSPESYHLPSTDMAAFAAAMGLPDKDVQSLIGNYLHHYEADTPIYGEYTDGTQILASGSGDNLNKWYEYFGYVEYVESTKQLEKDDGTILSAPVITRRINNLGKQVRKYGMYPCTYFSTPRYK